MILFSRIVSRTSLLHIWKCNDLELFAVRSSEPPALEPLVPRLEPSSLADRLSLTSRIEVLGRSTTLDIKLTMKRTPAPHGSILLHDTPRMLAASILFASSCLLTVVQLEATKGALRPRRHLLSKVLMVMRHPMEMCMKSTRMRKGSEHPHHIEDSHPFHLPSPLRREACTRADRGPLSRHLLFATLLFTCYLLSAKPPPYRWGG